MFATTAYAHSSGPRFAGAAYKQVGVETRVGGASPHQLVAMLFDGLVESLAQATGAIQAGKVDVKGKAIGRAVRIVEEGLKAGLNLEAGGELAADLQDLYRYLVLRLTHANLHNDQAAIDECKRLISPIRDAWTSIAPR